jgi:hypothetical protein
MNANLPLPGLPAPRNLLNDHHVPHVDDSDIPVGNTMEIERLTISPDSYSRRYIIITCFVGFLLAFVAGVFVPIVMIEIGRHEDFTADVAQLIAIVQLAILLVGFLFSVYLYKVLVRPTNYVLEMERVVPGQYAAPLWIDVEPIPPFQAASSLLSTWRARIVNVAFRNGAHISTNLGPGPRRDEIIEKSKLGLFLFEMDDALHHYAPVSFQLDDQLPSELMIPKIHQLGIDPQLLATRVNQAANSIDLTSASNGDRKSALIQARSVSNAADPWSLTVAAVTADVQSKTRVADNISAFLMAQ